MFDASYETKFQNDAIYKIAEALHVRMKSYKITDEISLDDALLELKEVIQKRQQKHKKAESDRKILTSHPELLEQYNTIDDERLKPEDISLAKAKMKELRSENFVFAESGANPIISSLASVMGLVAKNKEAAINAPFLTYVTSNLLSSSSQELLNVEAEKRAFRTQTNILKNLHREFDQFAIAERQKRTSNADKMMYDIQTIQSNMSRNYIAKINCFMSGLASAAFVGVTLASGGAATLPIIAGVIATSAAGSYFINNKANPKKVSAENEVRKSSQDLSAINRQMYIASYQLEASDKNQKSYQLLDENKRKVNERFNKVSKVSRKYALISLACKTAIIGGAVLATSVLSPAALLVTTGAALGVYSSVDRFVKSCYDISKSVGNFANAYKSFKPKLKIRFGKEKVKNNANTIELDHVAVNKRDEKDSLKASDEILFLSNDKLHIGTGITLLSGASGAGKSSLINLLMHSNEIDGGHIRIGNMTPNGFEGTDYTDLAFAEPAKNIALCTQKPEFMEMSVDEYIRLANPDASEELVRKVKDLVGIKDRTSEDENLPGEFIPSDKIISMTGKNVSGGQANRLNLAQALIKDSPIMILDEPTAGVDRTMADNILNYLNENKDKKTIIYITHEVDDVKKLKIDQALDIGRDDVGQPATMLRYDLCDRQVKNEFLKFFADRRVKRSPASGTDIPQKKIETLFKQSENRPVITKEKVDLRLEHAKELLRSRNPSLNGGIQQEDLVAYKKIMGKPKEQANLEADQLFQKIKDYKSQQQLS